MQLNATMNGYFNGLLFLSTILAVSSALDISNTHSSSQSRRQVLSNIAYSSTLLTLPKSAIASTDSVIAVPSIDLPTPSTLPAKPFPLASFGLQIYDNDTAYKLTTTALNAGYRNFFASVLAGNQKGFAQAIRDTNIPRDEIYICGTVLSNRAKNYKDAYDKTLKGCMENLNVMEKNSDGKIDYLDMIMLDYPCIEEEGVKGQWDAFSKFLEEKHVVHLAVSNFSPRQLDICSERGPVPTVNQLPYSIANHPKGVMEENVKRNVHVQSWSPLSTTLPRYKNVMAEIGQKYEKSAAQVGLRWIIQKGGSYSVQSKKATHFAEDLNVFDFELSDRDMDTLNNLQPPVAFS
jgi:diketogulonate reductase-like aldo/keto reductase